LNAGTVFEIAKTATVYASVPTVLFSFDYSNGSLPAFALIMDASGKLVRYHSWWGRLWVRCRVCSTSIAPMEVPPNGALLLDAKGDLFSTTATGGSLGKGRAFEIAKTVEGYSSAALILANFDGVDGASSMSSLLAETTYLCAKLLPWANDGQ
jgi:hypothetical protein